MLFMWSHLFRSSDIVTPSSLVAESRSTAAPLMVIGARLSFFFPKYINISLWPLSRLCCGFLNVIVCEFVSVSIHGGFVNILICRHWCFQTINHENKFLWPDFVPYDTPSLTGCREDMCLSMRTYCCLFRRQSIIHRWQNSGMFDFLNFCNKIRLSMRSNALLNSSSSTLSYVPASSRLYSQWCSSLIRAWGVEVSVRVPNWHGSIKSSIVSHTTLSSIENLLLNVISISLIDPVMWRCICILTPTRAVVYVVNCWLALTKHIVFVLLAFPTTNPQPSYMYLFSGYLILLTVKLNIAF